MPTFWLCSLVIYIYFRNLFRPRLLSILVQFHWFEPTHRQNRYPCRSSTSQRCFMIEYKYLTLCFSTCCLRFLNNFFYKFCGFFTVLVTTVDHLCSYVLNGNKGDLCDRLLVIYHGDFWAFQICSFLSSYMNIIHVLLSKHYIFCHLLTLSTRMTAFEP